MKPLRHPARYYIYYLFSKRTVDSNTIVQTLDDLDLLVPPKDHPDWKEDHKLFVAEIKAAQLALSTTFPANYNPHDLKHKPTVEFLRRHQILDMWSRDKFVAGASEILIDPHLRRMVEVMLLGPLDATSIAKRVRDRFELDEVQMNARVIQSYAHYYWDHRAMNREQWKYVLNWRAAKNQKRISNGEKTFLVGGEDVTDLQLALGAPRTSAGAALTIYAATGSSESLKESTMFRTLRDFSLIEFMKTYITMQRSGIQKAQAMQQLMSQIVSAQEQLDMRRGASAELMEEFQKIETDYDRGKLATVHQLPVSRVIDAEIVKDTA